MGEKLGLDLLLGKTPLLLQTVLVLFRLFLAEIPRVEAFQAEPLGVLLPAFAHDLYHACSLHPGDLETLGQMAVASHPEVIPSQAEIRGVADLPCQA